MRGPAGAGHADARGRRARAREEIKSYFESHLLTDRCARRRVHVFGHTHINTVHTFDDVTYVQDSIGYGCSNSTELQLVFDGSSMGVY